MYQRAAEWITVLFPLLGLIFFGVVLAPFAVAYLALESQARNLASLSRFYLGSFFWPFTLSAVFEFLELQNDWLPASLGLLALLAPVGGVLLDRVWRQKRFLCAFVTSVLMAAGTVFHLVYLGSMDNNPTYSEQSLKGTWKGEDGELVLTDGGGWSRDGDEGLIVNAKRYRVVRSFGQLCLTEDWDPDGMTIRYRKMRDR